MLKQTEGSHAVAEAIARAAEEVVFGEISTGAESDLQQLTDLARQMVGRWGMSEEIGPLSALAGRSRRSSLR